VLALESFSNLNNFNMGVRVAIPRPPIVNVNGAPSIFTEFTGLSKNARLSTNALDALDRLIKSGQTLGTHAQDLRGRSFAFFSAGTSLGWLGMIYDSAGIVGTNMSADSIPPLSSAADVVKAALVMLDSAYAYANDPAAGLTGGFPLPSGTSWMGDAPQTQDQFKRLIRSYRARFRAGVARTPAQRAAVDWPSVIADCENGIAANLLITVGGSTGWSLGENSSQMHVDPGWSQMSMMYFGMADVSGAYAQFIATPLSTRQGYFLVITPDQRWPQGATRAAQRTASVQPTGFTSKPYISNRSVAEVPGDGWGISFYDFYRLKYIRNASNVGQYPEFAKAENDLLAAEGYIRTGNLASAAAKIDLTRVGNGQLPALSGNITTAAQAVPGGVNCVPQVPSGSVVSCGNIMEAMKWEKRMETSFSCMFVCWWPDSRGWGDLPMNSGLQWPIPNQELDARNHVIYSYGGGLASSAPKGNYGW
jgi:hypothetical protein